MRIRLLLLLIPGLLCAQSLADFEKKVTQFTLPNGLTFLIIERHEAPVVSFHTYVNAGAVDDPGGSTGLAHMFEHMAFKGTPDIGTKNWTQEKKALDAIETVYDRLVAERNKGFRADAEKIKTLEANLKDAIATADSYVEPNEYDRIVESNGGVGMNAGTSEDSTQYFYSFPSNRLELWFLLESERFLRPVLREFYKERDVVREERRMRVESSPQGQLVETLLATAYAAHPYHNWAGGWPSDIESFRRPDAEAFFKKYYVPRESHHRHRGRCESGRREEARRALLRPDPHGAHAAHGAHQGASTARREARAGRFRRAADHDYRLQAARSVFQGRRPVGRAERGALGRAHRHHLQGAGAG